MIWITMLTLLICTINIAIICVSALQKPTASVVTSSILEGETVVIKCNYINPQEVKFVGWYYNHKPRDINNILFGFNKEFPAPGDNGENRMFVMSLKDGFRASGREVSDGFEVTIRNVTVADDCAIVCVVADNGYARGALESNPVAVNVAVRPAIGVLQSKDSLKTSSAEESHFECKSGQVKPVNSITITWQLDNQLVLEETEQYQSVNSDGKTFEITSVIKRKFSHEDNQKKLVCKVTWTYGRHLNELISVDAGILHVLFAPVWYGKSTKVYAELDSKVEMHCLVKSNPPVTTYRWYEHGGNTLIHTGQNLTFNKVTNIDFTSYDCEVTTDVYEKQKFTAVLLESSQPTISGFEVLPNITSTRATIKWVIGSDGGHPPVLYSLYGKKYGDSIFQLLNGSISSNVKQGGVVYYNIMGLQPSTQYQFKLLAKNTRKVRFPTKSDTSKALTVTAITKNTPDITITDVNIHLDTLTVSWDFQSVIKDLDFENYIITVKIKYGVQGEDDPYFLTYPKQGTIPVLKSPQKITKNFDSSKTYMVSLLIYENGYLTEVPVGPQRLLDVENKPSSMATWVIAVAVLAVILIVAVLVLAVIYIVRRTRKGITKKGQKGYSEHFLLDKNVYDELRMKQGPPKLPSRNSLQRAEQLVFHAVPSQGNTITALQTVYLTQQFCPVELGYAPPVPTNTSQREPIEQDIELEPLPQSDQSEYVLPTQPTPVNVQITVNQNNSPSVTCTNSENSSKSSTVMDENTIQSKGPIVTDENGEELEQVTHSKGTTIKKNENVEDNIVNDLGPTIEDEKVEQLKGISYGEDEKHILLSPPIVS